MTLIYRFTTFLCSAFCLFLTSSAAQSYQATGRFEIVGTKMIDPDGKEFIPIGVNMNGRGWVWDGDPSQDVDAIEKGWRFNIIRVNNILGCKDGPFRNRSLDLDAVVKTFTSRRIVVMFEQHDVPEKDSQLECSARWWKEAALKYKNNPYVWFNPFNEPGGLGIASSPQWVPYHRRIIQTIRDRAGADNIIILDGIAAGQDHVNGWGACGFARDSDSAILSWGSTIASFQGKTYKNVGFSFHSYGSGGCADETLNDKIIANYIDRVHAKGLFLVVGESGYYSGQEYYQKSGSKAVRSTFRVALQRKVGVLAWHGQPGDGYVLTWPGGGIGSINSLTQPSNLTWIGKLFWEATHKRGFGLRSSPTSPSTPTPSCPSSRPHPSRSLLPSNFCEPEKP